MNQTIGTTLENFITTNQTFHVIVALLLMISVVVGVIYVKRGLLDLLNTDGRGSPATNALFKIAGGGALTSLPFAITVMIYTFFQNGANTLGQYDFSRADPSFDTGSSTGGIRGETGMELFANFALDAAGPLSQAVMLTAMVWGVYMIFTSITRLANNSNPNSPHHDKASSHLYRMAIGTIALAMPTVLDISSISLLGDFTSRTSGLSVDYKNFDKMCSILSYGAQGGQSCSAANDDVLDYTLKLLTILLYGIVPFGLIAFFSGLRGMYLATEQGGGGGKTVFGSSIKLIAGVLMINLQMVSCVTVRTISPIPALLNSEPYQQMCRR